MKKINVLKLELLERAKEAVDYIKSQNIVIPKIVVVLGSGIKALENLKNEKSIDYSQIPYFPEVTVAGHSGKFTCGYINDIPIGVLRGRFHCYEGYEYKDVVFPATVMHALGVQIYVLTNAAGGLNRTFKVGDLMIIRDHFNFQSGIEPLITEPIRYPTFYDEELYYKIRKAAIDSNIPIQEGVYCCGWGPTYETPAEINTFTEWGMDAVGMSTVPEATWAKYLGMQVIGISCITNIAYTSAAQATACHEEVVDVAKSASLKLDTILKNMIKQ